MAGNSADDNGGGRGSSRGRGRGLGRGRGRGRQLVTQPTAAPDNQWNWQMELSAEQLCVAQSCSWQKPQDDTEGVQAATCLQSYGRPDCTACKSTR